MNANERKLKAKELFIISTLSAEICTNNALHINVAHDNHKNICVHLRDAHGCANAASAGSARAAQFAFSCSFSLDS